MKYIFNQDEYDEFMSLRAQQADRANQPYSESEQASLAAWRDRALTAEGELLRRAALSGAPDKEVVDRFGIPGTVPAEPLSLEYEGRHGRGKFTTEYCPNCKERTFPEKYDLPDVHREHHSSGRCQMSWGISGKDLGFDKSFPASKSVIPPGGPQALDPHALVGDRHQAKSFQEDTAHCDWTPVPKEADEALAEHLICDNCRAPFVKEPGKLFGNGQIIFLQNIAWHVPCIAEQFPAMNEAADRNQSLGMFKGRLIKAGDLHDQLLAEAGKYEAYR